MELIQNNYDQYTLLNQAEQQREVAAEVIVPDTQADVYSVLTSAAQCQIKQKTVRQDAVVIEGVVEIEALCQEEEPDRWQCIRGSIPFTQEIQAAGCREDSIAQLRLEVLRCDAQIRNPRKLQLQAQLGALVQVFQKSRFVVTESAGGSEQEDVHLLTDTVELEVLRAVAEKKLVAADEVQTAAHGQLLHYAVDWRQEEQRILSGKVMLRGNACIQAVFFQENSLQQQEYRIPFSQVLECEGVEQGDTVTVDYQTLQTQVTLLEGETAALSCSLSGTATACVTRRMKLQVLQDLYSTRYESECQREPLACPAWKCFERSVSAEETCQPEEAAATVMDCRCRARGFVDDRGRMGGIYTFRILYCCGQGHLHCAEHTVKVVCDEEIRAEKLTVRAGWQNLSVQAEDGALRIRFTALLRGRGLVPQPCRQVSACSLNPDKRRQAPPPGTLLLRAVAEQETVWSIAKQYGSRTGQILAANRLENGAQLTPGQLMMIPFSG